MIDECEFRSNYLAPLLFDIIISLLIGGLVFWKVRANFGIFICLLLFVILFFFTAFYAHNFLIKKDKIVIGNHLKFFGGTVTIYYSAVEYIDVWDVVGSFDLSLQVKFLNGHKKKYGFRGLTDFEKEEIVTCLRKQGVASKRIIE